MQQRKINYYEKQSIGIPQVFIYLFLNFFELPLLKFDFIF